MDVVSQCLPFCRSPLHPEWPLLDSRDTDSQGAQQDWQPDGLQSDGNAAPGVQGQRLRAAQHPQTSARAPPQPELVHGHTVGCAEIGDFPEEGEDCRSLRNNTTISLRVKVLLVVWSLRLTAGVFRWCTDFYIACFNGVTVGNLQDWFWQQNSERVPFFWVQTKEKEKLKHKDKKHQKEMGYRMKPDCMID